MHTNTTLTLAQVLCSEVSVVILLALLHKLHHFPYPPFKAACFQQCSWIFSLEKQGLHTSCTSVSRVGHRSKAQSTARLSLCFLNYSYYSIPAQQGHSAEDFCLPTAQSSQQLSSETYSHCRSHQVKLPGSVNCLMEATLLQSTESSCSSFTKMLQPHCSITKAAALLLNPTTSHSHCGKFSLCPRSVNESRSWVTHTCQNWAWGTNKDSCKTPHDHTLTASFVTGGNAAILENH